MNISAYGTNKKMEKAYEVLSNANHTFAKEWEIFYNIRKEWRVVENLDLVDAKGVGKIKNSNPMMPSTPVNISKNSFDLNVGITNEISVAPVSILLLPTSPYSLITF